LNTQKNEGTFGDMPLSCIFIEDDFMTVHRAWKQGYEFNIDHLRGAICDKDPNLVDLIYYEANIRPPVEEVPHLAAKAVSNRDIRTVKTLLTGYGPDNPLGAAGEALLRYAVNETTTAEASK